MSRVGIVAIGRNEGERLIRCLDSVVGQGHTVVYVDSHSSDGSVAAARIRGVDVVELDPTQPMHPSLARGAGARRVLELAPDCEFIQFFDGDCEMEKGWIETALAFMDANPQHGMVLGRRRERFPDASPYNLLADIDWDSPIGPIKYSHGDMFVRVSAYQSCGGWRSDVLFDEDTDFLVRLRGCGWRLERVDAPMSIHDMSMTRLGQWWKRQKRTGGSYAEGFLRYGFTSERLWIKEILSILFWGAVLPLMALLLAIPTHGISLLMLLGYVFLYVKIRQAAARCGMDQRRAHVFALSTTLGKIPGAIGVISNWLRIALKRRRSWIIYKPSSTMHSTT
jgi:GT2 family glycosyltransferase